MGIHEPHRSELLCAYVYSIQHCYFWHPNPNVSPISNIHQTQPDKASLMIEHVCPFSPREPPYHHIFATATQSENFQNPNLKRTTKKRKIGIAKWTKPLWFSWLHDFFLFVCYKSWATFNVYRLWYIWTVANISHCFDREYKIYPRIAYFKDMSKSITSPALFSKLCTTTCPGYLWNFQKNSLEFGGKTHRHFEYI